MARDRWEQGGRGHGRYDRGYRDAPAHWAGPPGWWGYPSMGAMPAMGYPWMGPAPGYGSSRGAGGYGRDFGGGYGSDYKSDWQTERGDPFGDRRRGTPVQMRWGEFHPRDRDPGGPHRYGSEYDPHGNYGYREGRGYDRGRW